MEEFCSNVDFLKVINMLKQVFNMLTAIVPVVLVIIISVSIFKSVLGDDNKEKDVINAAAKKLIIAVSIFVIPSIVISLLSNILGSVFNKDFLCLNLATDSNIAALKVAKQEEEKVNEDLNKKEEEKEKEKTLIEDNSKKIKEQDYSSGDKIDPYTYVSKTFTPIVDGVQRPLQPGECMNWEDNCFCPNKTNAKGFQFIMESETGRTFKDTTASINTVNIKDTCDVISNRNSINVSKDVKENYEKALELLCQLKTTGINGYKISSVRTNGTYAMRTKADRTVCSPHSYGIAIDFSSGVTIDYNGKTYDPYTGQGSKTKSNYNEFINAIGGEANEANVNYIIWKYAFEPAGFEWGGEWRESSFDPMHYEVKP